MVTTLPTSITENQDSALILARAKLAYLELQPSRNTAIGSKAHDMLTPFTLELAYLYVLLEDVELRTSLATAEGDDLDNLGELFGVTRTPAAESTGTVTFSGTNTTVIPIGTRVSTTGPSPQVFATTAAGIIASGTAVIAVEAEVAGEAGNVGIGTITYLAAPVVAGVTSVTNAAATTGGADAASDDIYRAAIYDDQGARGEGGAAKHIRKWAREVAGVGGVRVVEASPQPGWVTIALLDADLLPASADLVLDVEDYILDPRRLSLEAETMTLSGFGGSVDVTQGDDTGTSVKFVYSASGDGIATLTGLHTLLVQPGIWRIRARVKYATAGAGNLLTVEVYNTTAAAVAPTRPNGAVPSTETFATAGLSTAFAWVEIEAAYLGTESLELRITRENSNTTSELFIDQIELISTMSRDDQDVGKSPAGMRLNVIAATDVPIDVAADITYSLGAGQTEGTVQTAIEAALVAYFAGLAFADDNDVRRSAVENAIFDVSGVLDVTTVTIDGGTANIPVGYTEVATFNGGTWT